MRACRRGRVTVAARVLGTSRPGPPGVRILRRKSAERIVEAMTTHGSRVAVGAVALAILLGAWARVNGADHRWLWQDEAITLLHVAGRTTAEIDGGPRALSFGALAAELRDPAGGPGRVVSSLAADDPQHPPAYYLAQRMWNDAHGGVLGVRSLSIFFGAVAVVAIGWFAAVLGGVRAGRIALACAAVSPFLVLYGQQLREYGLWSALIALSSGLLVLAVRGGGVGRWAAYAAGLAAALWTSPLSLLLLAGHAAWTTVVAGRRRLAAFALAASAALAAYAPWIAVMVANRARAEAGNAWSSTPYPPAALAAKVVFTISAAFTDLAYADPRGLLANGAVLVVLALAVVVVARVDRRAALLLGAIAVATAGLILADDLIVGAHRSASSRYLAPAVIVALVTVACALSRAPARVATAATATLVVLGAWSSLLGTSAPVWWDNHGDAELRSVAAELGRVAEPHLAYEGPCSSLLALALAAPPRTQVQCRIAHPPLATGTFVLSPSDPFVAEARARGFASVPVVDPSESSAVVRAFRRRTPAVDDQATLRRLERVRAVDPPGVPEHVETSIQDLCYAERCYHDSQRAVPLEEVARYVTWAFADGSIADDARKHGIRTIAYLDPSVQYDPKRDVAPLASEDEQTYLHGCDGKRASVRLGDLDGYLMDQGSSHFRELLKRHVDRNVRPHYDALFADDVFAATDSFSLKVMNKPCKHDFVTEREATFGAWAASGIPIIFNGLGLAPDDGRPSAHALAALDGPGVVGGMYEMCLTAPGDGVDQTRAHKRVDAAWRSIQNSHLQTVASAKRFFCFSESETDGASAAGIDERKYVYASFLLVYDPAFSVLQEGLRSSRLRVPVFPETRIVALDPVVRGPQHVESLQRPAGAYAREYRRCFDAGKPIGACAAVVNPSSDRSVPLPVHGYRAALSLSGGALPDGGTLTFRDPVPSALAPATGTVLVR